MLGKAVTGIDHKLVTRGIRHLIVLIGTVALFGIEVGITGVQVQITHGLRGPENIGLETLVTGAAQIVEAVGGGVVDDLVVEIDAVQVEVDTHAVPRGVAHTGLVVPGQLGTDCAFLDDLRNLRRAQGLLGVGVDVPGIVRLIAHGQARQPFLGFVLTLEASDAVAVVHAGVFVAHTRGNGQLVIEQADGVADIERTGVVIELPVAERRCHTGGQALAVDLVVDIFADITGTEQPGLADVVAIDSGAEARFRAPDLEVTRAVLLGDCRTVRSERQADHEVAVAVVGEVGPAELHRIKWPHGAQALGIGAPDAIGVTLETVQRAGRLTRVVLVVLDAERSG